MISTAPSGQLGELEAAAAIASAYVHYLHRRRTLSSAVDAGMLGQDRPQLRRSIPFEIPLAVESVFPLYCSGCGRIGANLS
jgi:hypothetical protein